MTDDLRTRFAALADRWREETRGCSFIGIAMRRPAMRQIIALGPPVVPLIFEELERRSDHWFLALWELLGDGPDIPEHDAGVVMTMRERWLEWGRQKGYLRRE